MILVTGGAGYIGSHACLALIEAGHNVMVLDNFSNSNLESLKRVEKITNDKIHLVTGDIRDRSLLRGIFSTVKIEGVIHFAGLKSISESLEKPLAYYDNNVAGSIVLTEIMDEFDVRTLVFSSTAAVYGENELRRLSEDTPIGKISHTYGKTKLMVEELLTDLSKSNPAWKIALLRYFNPVGAHKSGFIGEDPTGVPSNLVPSICQVAIGKKEKLSIFGNDYDTADGTGVRDFIHVQDLAEGHVRVFDWLKKQSGINIFNLGTGSGHSVLEVVKAFELVLGSKINFEILPRRKGDLAEVYADCSKAENVLGWKASRGINEMCEDAWRWQKNNPNGYMVV